MKKQWSQQFVIVGMVAASAVILGLAVFAWTYAQQTVAAAAYVGHTHQVRTVISQLQASLYKAESAQRGYLATREGFFRDERIQAIAALEGELHELSVLTSDNTSRAAQIDQLRLEIDGRAQLYRQSENLLAAGSGFALEQRIQQGAQAMNRVLPLIEALDRHEVQLLQERMDGEKQRVQITQVFFIAFIGVLILLMPAICWRMYRDAVARHLAETLADEERTFDAIHAQALTVYNGQGNRRTVLEKTLALLAQKGLFPTSAFYGHEEIGGGLHLVAAHAAPDDIRPALKLNEGPIGTAAREGGPVYLEDFDDANGLRIETGLGKVRPASLLMQPVLHQGQLFGVLALAAKMRLKEREREFVARLSAQLGVALHNLNQLEATGLLAEQLRSRGEDIQRKNAELERANRMKSEFLANMSHELRTPLNAIIGFSELMKDGLTGELQPEQLEYMGDIYASGKHLLSLINDILDLSKIESGHVPLELEEADPAQLVSSVMSVLQERAMSARVKLITECDDKLGLLCMDMRKAKQIVYNLVSNALKFTPEGGSVTMSVTRVPKSQIASVQSRAGVRVFAPREAHHSNYLEIRVSDTGIGISPDDLERLFQAFVQIDSSLSRQYAGTGLGLTMVKRLTELHGGGLMVQSVEDKGTVFAVWLPWREVGMSEADARILSSPLVVHSMPDDVPQEGPLVLVVEDDPRAAQLMRLQLQSQGYRVEVAPTGEDGLRRAAELRPATIVLDIILPGMDGWDLLARLKEHRDTSSIPVVIVSITDEAQRGFALGAAQVLVKPVAQAELLAALEAAGLDDPSPDARVLVVDDDPKAVALVSKHLQVAGYTPIGAYGGQEALDLVRSERPELIVLDLMMPRVSGFDVVEGLREHRSTSDIPIIVLTAKLLTQDDRDQLNGKVQQIMEKTHFQSGGLVSEVKRALAKSRSAARVGA